MVTLGPRILTSPVLFLGNRSAVTGSTIYLIKSRYNTSIFSVVCNISRYSSLYYNTTKTNKRFGIIMKLVVVINVVVTYRQTRAHAIRPLNLVDTDKCSKTITYYADLNNEISLKRFV